MLETKYLDQQIRFYYDKDGKRIRILSSQLYYFTVNGKITPETILETIGGIQVQAGKVGSLYFKQAPPVSSERIKCNTCSGLGVVAGQVGFCNLCNDTRKDPSKVTGSPADYCPCPNCRGLGGESEINILGKTTMQPAQTICRNCRGAGSVKKTDKWNTLKRFDGNPGLLGLFLILIPVLAGAEPGPLMTIFWVSGIALMVLGFLGMK